MRAVDLIVIGAGPAGMAAAIEAAEAGLSVALLDEQPEPGGQIYRAVTGAGAGRGAVLGRDYLDGARLVGAVRAAGVTYLGGAVVWQIEPDAEGFIVTYSCDGRAAQMRAARLVLATGALERAVPIPGWTLPGVMTAGAGQILLKASGLVAERAVLAGSGPLLYLLAVQMVRAGQPPLAMVETQRFRDTLRALPHLARGLRGWRTLAKGLGLLLELRRAGVRRITCARDLAVEGEGRAVALRFSAGGRVQRIACDTVLLHQGVVPNTQISRALRMAHDWHSGQQAFVPRLDTWGESTVPGVFVAGDGAGIAGAVASEAAGRLAGVQVAHQLGRIDAATRDARARRPEARLTAERALRPFLEVAYPPAAQVLSPVDDTIICRCEEVTAGQVRGWARLGCTGPNQTKAFGRVGMGPCQGRYCALSVTMLLAEAHG
ncbi:MAG: NAD(P)/FAD-dependent oxidoreductase, partial [Rhodobacterales bacterium]|nr:NAD(P)/FAD-dependent oxidoreductase [Rhodobacterales bacterium]MDX5411921.1 NAD(P)/FAD-dependent oxidoreductase [Rhodobacterales bacterium]